jgi:hypothetical protein
MNSATRVTLAALLLGNATLVAAQTPAQKFASEIRAWQSYVSGSPAYRLTTPTFSDEPQDPTAGLTTAEMQAVSSEGPEWHPKQPPVSSGPAFAQANPHGLPFDYYQAVAADSDAFKYPPSAGEPAFATASGDSMFAGRKPKSPLRIATDKTAERQALAEVEPVGSPWR